MFIIPYVKTLYLPPELGKVFDFLKAEIWHCLASIRIIIATHESSAPLNRAVPLSLDLSSKISPVLIRAREGRVWRVCMQLCALQFSVIYSLHLY